MSVRRSIAIVVLSVLCIFNFAAPGKASEDLSWPNLPSGNHTGLAIVDSIDGPQQYSHLFVWTGDREVPCRDLDDAQCRAFPDSSWGMLRVLPPCEVTSADDDCVLGLTVQSGDEIREAKLLRTLDAPTWKGDLTRGLIPGGTESLWSNPFSSNPTEGLQIKAKGYYDNKSKSLAHQSWTMKNFQAVVTPYYLNTGNFEPVKALSKSLLPPGSYSGDFSGNWAWKSPPKNCLFVETNGCGIRQPFSPIDRLSLSLRLSSSQTGWLSGRLGDPTIVVTKATSSTNNLTISAAPVEVAHVQAWTDSPTPEMMAFSQNYMGGQIIDWRLDVGLPFLDLYRNFLHDTATKAIQTWSVTDGFGQPANKCLQSNDSFVGLVSTNATVYQPGAPEFNGDSLNYQVGSMHFLPNGELNRGRYSLLLNSKAARCLYGFKAAPIQAVVSIYREAGTTEVATTTMTESGGYIKLLANNFTFSNPKINVKFIQATNRKSPELKCFKGKVIRIISGKNCPKGFRLTSR